MKKEQFKHNLKKTKRQSNFERERLNQKDDVLHDLFESWKNIYTDVYGLTNDKE